MRPSYLTEIRPAAKGPAGIDTQIDTHGTHTRTSNQNARRHPLYVLSAEHTCTTRRISATTFTFTQS